MVGKLFVITCEVLIDLELYNEDDVKPLKYWDSRLGIWVKIREGYVVDFSHSKIGNSLFLKAAPVTRYYGFDKLLEAVSPRCVSHLRNNLPGTRESVHLAKFEKLTQLAHSKLATSTAQPIARQSHRAVTIAIDGSSDSECEHEHRFPPVTLHSRRARRATSQSSVIEISDDQKQSRPHKHKGKGKQRATSDDSVIEISDDPVLCSRARPRDRQAIMPTTVVDQSHHRMSATVYLSAATQEESDWSMDEVEKRLFPPGTL